MVKTAYELVQKWESRPGTIPMTTKIFDIVCLLLFFESTIEELDATVEFVDLLPL